MSDIHVTEVVVPEVRVTEVIVADAQVITQLVVTEIRVTGGIPGPPGLAGADGGVALEAHIVDLDPHPAYDDLASFTLLFENGLV